MSKEVDELKVQVAAAWTCFDTLASEVEALKGQTVIHIGRALEKARAMKAQLQKTQALPSVTRNEEEDTDGCPLPMGHGGPCKPARRSERATTQDDNKGEKK